MIGSRSRTAGVSEVSRILPAVRGNPLGPTIVLGLGPFLPKPCPFPEVMLVSRPRLPRRSSDDDPTGIRELLASLPDPGPMPREVADRIALRLAEEKSLPTRFDDITRSQDGRPRARIVGWLAAAAAAVLVGTLGTSMLNRGSDPVPPSALGADFARSPRSVASPSTAAGQSDASHPTALPPIAIRRSGRTYTPADLATQATSLPALAESYEAARLRPVEQEPLTTREGVSACLQGIGVPPPKQVWVDLAHYGKTPAAVIVSNEGPRTVVRVVELSCPQSTRLLAGPLRVS